MRQKIIPIEKQSKQVKKGFYASRRGNWGIINPVTRKPANPRVYKRKNIKDFHQEAES